MAGLKFVSHITETTSIKGVRMKVSIEEINGKKCTFIRRPFDEEWVKQQLGMELGVAVEWRQPYESPIIATLITRNGARDGYYSTAFHEWHKSEMELITILPPLPRHPKPEDAKLLYRYMSEGLTVVARYTDPWEGEDYEAYDLNMIAMLGTCLEITHCIDEEGNKVEVAIDEGS